MQTTPPALQIQSHELMVAYTVRSSVSTTQCSVRHAKTSQQQHIVFKTVSDVDCGFLTSKKFVAIRRL